jgi:hypothetical protein
MFKDARHERVAHTKQKPRPRLVTKAHRLENDEQQLALDAAERTAARIKRKNPPKR